jgi:hypothetical protein
MAVEEGKCYNPLLGKLHFLDSNSTSRRSYMHTETEDVFTIFSYRIRTYEHEATWEKALVTYDLETSISSSTRQSGIIQVRFCLCLPPSVHLLALVQCISEVYAGSKLETTGAALSDVRLAPQYTQESCTGQCSLLIVPLLPESRRPFLSVYSMPGDTSSASCGTSSLH